MSFANKRVLLSAILAIAVFLVGASTATADVITYNTCLPTPPGVYVGTGNSPCNWATLTTPDGVQLGLTDIERFVGAIVPTGTTNAPGDTYLVNPAPGPLSAQDFGLSIYDPNGLNPTGASLTMTDLSNGEHFTFNPALLPDNGYLNQDGVATATGTFTQYGATSIGMQNYENNGFFGSFGFPYSSSMAGDTFQYTLDYQPTLPGVDPQLTIFQAATPEPNDIALIGIAGLGIIIATRRRQRLVRATMRN